MRTMRDAQTPAPAPAETETLLRACQRLGISERHGRYLVAADKFPCAVIRAGARILVVKAELDRLLGVQR